MRKILSCLCAVLTVVCILSLSSCSATKKNIVGTYNLISATGGGMSIPDEQLNNFKSMGLTATLEVRDDNTAEMDIFGQKVEMTYNINKMIFTVNGKNTKFTFDGSKITIVTNDTTMVFLKRD